MGGSSLPTNLTISTNKGTYSLGETVVITPSANNATHYAISIWKGSFGTGTRLYANFNLPGAITFRPTQTGTYTIRADAKNSAGYISQERTFTVTTSTGLPTNFSIATDKSTYTSGEAVTITPSANNATRYAISIWLGSFGSGTRLYANFNLNGAVTFIPTQPGTYTIRADAKNNAGFISQECTFTVTAPSSLPTNMTVTTDKYAYALGETVTITPSANNATHYAISVWLGAFGSGQRLYVNYRLAGGITFNPTKSGAYTVRADAKNGSGFISQECTFIVN